MQVTVHYKTGKQQTFIVPGNIYATEFRQIAEAVGGQIKKLVFSQPSDINSFKYKANR